MSLDALTLRLASIMPCEDRSCCCIPNKCTVMSISIINFMGCVLDLLTSRQDCPCETRQLIDSIKKLQVTLFQMANLLLLLGSVFEKAILVDIYVWYTLGHVVTGLGLAVRELGARAACGGGVRALVAFVPDVLLLFVIFRCLPLVDRYRRHLYSVAVNPY